MLSWGMRVVCRWLKGVTCNPYLLCPIDCLGISQGNLSDTVSYRFKRIYFFMPPTYGRIPIDLPIGTRHSWQSPTRGANASDSKYPSVTMKRSRNPLARVAQSPAWTSRPAVRGAKGRDHQGEVNRRAESRLPFSASDMKNLSGVGRT